MSRSWRLVAALCLLMGALGADAQAQDRYALAGGCYGLRSQALDRFVVKTSDGGYRASATTVGAADPLRMQATALGRYLFYGRSRDFVAFERPQAVPSAPAVPAPVPTVAVSDVPLPVVSAAPVSPPPVASGKRVQSAAGPSESADWKVDVAGGAYEISLPAEGRTLAVGDNGELVLYDGTPPGNRGRFAFEPAGGCPAYPEIETNATGDPSRGATPFGEVSGLLDAHMHMMAFEFLGGRAHCGRPWHPYGVTFALVDCPDHEPKGAGAVAENALSYGNPVGFHDTTGWPTFKDWPNHASLTHEQSYYKWLERSWRGGLRLYVNLLVDNAVLCEVYPYKKNSCNEMDSVRLQAVRIRELQDYIDAQSGGPGKGWFRIVTSPFEARRVINDGKLAVVLGIEVSKLFDCGLDNERPECTASQIDSQLDQVRALGVRDMELVNKFDNALAGVAGDNGTTGVVVNNGNKIETGKYWQLRSCEGDGHVHDRAQPTVPGIGRDTLAGNILSVFGKTGQAPAYGPSPHCNVRGLSSLGAHLIRRMIAKKMIVDPDHLSVRARQETLTLLEKARYSGVVSSHSWSTPDSIPRIYRLGGVITPYAGASKDFIDEWRQSLPVRDKRYYQGVGWGADMNGFGAQGGPRNGPNPVTYPFKSFDGAVTLDRQRSGERVFDINTDGVAHHGLYPDWVEDLRKQAGQPIVDDLARGPEAYLQMWERAEGIPTTCQAARARLTQRGLGRARLGASSDALLRRAGQPQRRPGRSWSYCVSKRGRRPAGRMTTVLTPLGQVAAVASTASGHRAAGVAPGARANRLRGRRFSRLSRSLRARRGPNGTRYLFAVRRGRVASVAVVARSSARSRNELRAYARLAGLR